MSTLLELLAVSDLITSAESALNTGQLPVREQQTLQRAVQRVRQKFQADWPVDRPFPEGVVTVISVNRLTMETGDASAA